MSDRPLEILLQEKELTGRLHVSLGTLRTWRSEAKDLVFTGLGKMIRYAPSDIKRWLLSRHGAGEGAEVGR